ncbi:MAG: hypothetical protein ABMA02_12855 [Saprospiraceae bacterium]
MLTKTNFWRISVLTLLLLNIALVAYFSLRQERHPQRRGDEIKNFIVERLHFDAAQTAAYEGLIERHRASIRAKEQDVRAAKQRLYSSLQGSDFSEKDTLIQQIGRLQTGIEQVHFDHFLEVKNLCRPEQVADFRSVADQLARLLSPRRPPKPARK